MKVGNYQPAVSLFLFLSFWGNYQYSEFIFISLGEIGKDKNI